MRFEITINRTGKQKMLPMDYQYYLSAWIYKVIGKADHEFAGFLHASGYTTGTKHFKLFCYSPLYFGKAVSWKEKALFEVLDDQLSLAVSFHLAEAAEKFIIGLFNNQRFYIGDRFNGLELEVRQIERVPDPVVHETMRYRAISPVVVSFKEENSRYARYLSPTEAGYGLLLKQNMLNKLLAVPHASTLPEAYAFDFRLDSTTKSKLVTIKPYTSEQSKVRGFVFDLTLQCPVELHRLIVSSGIGEKNSMGFGWVEVID